MSTPTATGYGPLYATCVLRAFADHLIGALGEVRDRRIAVVPGDGDVLATDLAWRGATVVAGLEQDTAADAAAALGTLGVPAAPQTTLAGLAVATAGRVAAVHFTAAATHEAIALAALDVVGAATPSAWLAPLGGPPPGFVITPIADIARFDSPRQFYAAMVAERGLDAGLDAIERQRILARCVEALRPVTAYDDTVRLRIEADLVVRA